LIKLIVVNAKVPTTSTITSTNNCQISAAIIYASTSITNTSINKFKYI